MTMEIALRAKLLANAPLVAIVGQRITWTERPQGNVLPAVVLQVVADTRPQDFKARVYFRETRVQIDCFATTRSVAVNLREAVINALSFEGAVLNVLFGRVFINNVIDRGEDTDTGFVHRDLIDATIWHDA